MASALAEFTFSGGVAQNKGTHDWDSLLDGQIWQLTAGTDYNCKTSTFASLARNQAKKKKLGLRTNKVEGGIVIQAVPMDEGDQEPGEGETAPVVPPEPPAPPTPAPKPTPTPKPAPAPTPAPKGKSGKRK